MMSNKVTIAIMVAIILVCDVLGFCWWYKFGSMPQEVEEYLFFIGSIAIWVWWIIEIQKVSKEKNHGTPN